MSAIDDATRAILRDQVSGQLQRAINRWTSGGQPNAAERRRDKWLGDIRNAYRTEDLNPEDEPNFEQTWLQELEKLGEPGLWWNVEHC